MTVRVVTDSACSLPAEEVGEHGIIVVPMTLTIGGVAAHDGDTALPELVARLDEGVTTSGPTPGEIAAALTAADEGDGVVLLTVARAMSSTYDAARLALDHTGATVALVDTGTAAGAQGLVVLAAARRAAAGATLAEVEDHARRVSGRVQLVATLPSLDRLARGGHVPAAAAWARRWLGMHPLLEFRAGQARPLRPALSSDAALARITAVWARTRPPDAALHAAVLHALDPERARRLGEAVCARCPPAEAFIASFSTVMVAHTGPGLVGLAWWWETRG